MRRPTRNGGSDHPLTMALQIETVHAVVKTPEAGKPFPDELVAVEIAFYDRNDSTRKAFLRVNDDGYMSWEVEDDSEAEPWQ